MFLVGEGKFIERDVLEARAKSIIYFPHSCVLLCMFVYLK